MKQITRMGQPALETDAAGNRLLRIPVTFGDGTGFDWALPAYDLDRMIGWLVNLNREMIVQGEALPATEAEPPVVGPLTVHGAGFSVGNCDTDDITLVLQLAGSRLALQMPQANFLALGTDMMRVVQTASAQGLPN